MPQHQEVSLQQVVALRLFEIADYQRPYAWEAKQLKDLWEDLDLLGPQGSHYAGTLVVRDIRSGDVAVELLSDDGMTLTRCEVVDGQQRLTTCIILLDRVALRLAQLERDGVAKAGRIAKAIRATYGVLMIDGEETPRLRLGSGLNDYWVETIIGQRPFVGVGLTSAQRRLKEAVEFFDGQLDTLAQGVPSGVFFGRLKDLQRRITAGLKFLVYEVESSAEVGVIFETLNERGRPLTDLEKAKNYLLYLARLIPDRGADQLAERINKAWADIFANLSGEPRAVEDQLLRAHWLATRNPDERSWKGVDTIKKHLDRSRFVASATRLIPNHPGPDAQADAWNRLRIEVGEYVRSLRDCSFYFAEMFNPQARFEAFTSGKGRARWHSAALGRSGVVAIYRPLLLASRLRYPADGELYADLVDLCEKFSARVFVIEQYRSNTARSRFFRLAHDLYTGSDPDQVKQGLCAALWYYAPDDRVRKTLDEPLDWYHRQGHKYFLYEYELSLLSPGEQLPQLMTFTESRNVQKTTEHILPQTADAPCWTRNFTPEEHAKAVHTLGNLVLTLDNSWYSNKCFNDKRGEPSTPGVPPKRCYAQGKLHQERELAQYEDWTPATIVKRQQELADWALVRWHVDAPVPQQEAPDVVDLEPEGDQEDADALASVERDELGDSRAIKR